MLRLAFFMITVFFGATWAAAAETIDVKYYGKLDLCKRCSAATFRMKC